MDITTRNEQVVNLYKGMTCARDIAAKFGISERQVQRIVKEAKASRTQSESYILAIKQGRMKYHYKPEHLKAKRKTIGLRMRFEVLNRDKFKCALCGRKAGEAHRIEIDHINGDATDNRLDNLQTLCDLCNKGKAYLVRF